MELSPGVELVWSLAVRETMAARVEKIEPEHFFCGFLKLAELSDEDLQRVAARPDVAEALMPERDEIHKVFGERGWPTRRLRHRLRRNLGRGTYEHGGEVVHRSLDSRRFFEAAAHEAHRAGTRLTARLLLQQLLNNPTSEIKKALSDLSIGTPKAEAEATQPPTKVQEKPPVDLPYAHNLLNQTMLPKTPEVYAPQERVLSEALAEIGQQPLMLVCAVDVPLSDVLTNAAAAAQGRSRLLAVDHQKLPSQSDDAYDEQVATMLQQISEKGDSMAFFDLTNADRATAERLLSALEPMLTEAVGTPALVIALREPIHRAAVRANPAFETVFHTIWLHRLEDQKIPAAL